MGICQKPINPESTDIKRDELYPIHGFKRISLKILNSLCKIQFGNNKATGFFLKGLSKNKYLLTSNHVINRDLVTLYSIANIELYDGQNCELNLNNIQQYIKYYEKPIDITIIKINDLKEICNNVGFLDIHDNIKKDYSIYLYENVFTFGYPFGNDIECAPGRIVSISDKEFEHNCDTEQGFSGAPIILASNSKVIGIHKLGIINKKLNAGTFLGIIDEFNQYKDININNNKYGIFNAIDKMNIKIFQMEKSVCKVKSMVRGTYGTGFLCLIEDSDKKLSIPALLTSYHVLNASDFGEEIKLTFYDKEKIIKLDESSIIFSDKNIDVTSIKMKENEFDINDYLRIDEDIYKENEIDKLYKNTKIYIIGFRVEIQSISDGRFIELDKEDKNRFYYSCSTDIGLSGAPIINSNNMKVIGIHKGYDRINCYNLGIIIPKCVKQNAF